MESEQVQDGRITRHGHNLWGVRFGHWRPHQLQQWLQDGPLRNLIHGTPPMPLVGKLCRLPQAELNVRSVK
jgi:hypothetical protein